jgi:hypothetical protein
VRIFLTVNPRLVSGARFQTVRALVTPLDRLAELVVVPLDGIDFRRGRVQGWRRLPGAGFEPIGRLLPRGALWINWSDGFYLDHAALGFPSPGAFLAAQHDLYAEALAASRIGRVVNTTDAERATLKLWLAGPGKSLAGVIPSHRLAVGRAPAMRARLEALRARYGAVVVKPDWGGAGQRVFLVDSADAARAFAQRHAGDPARTHPLDHWCVQPRVRGPEKRFWFTGDRCVDARILVNRPPPWDPDAQRSASIERYWFYIGEGRAQDGQSTAEGGARRGGRAVAAEGVKPGRAAQFRRDLEVATAVWRRTGLELGCVDLIGDQVNEINGAGTTYTQYRRWTRVADARPALARWARALVRGLSA